MKISEDVQISILEGELRKREHDFEMRLRESHADNQRLEQILK